MIEELFDYDFYSPSMENVLYICNELDEIIKDGHKELMIICYDYGCGYKTMTAFYKVKSSF